MHLKETIKGVLKKYKIYSKIYNLFGGNHISGKYQNDIECNGCLMKRCKISIEGSRNKIIIDRDAVLSECLINIRGNNNKIYISEQVQMKMGGFYLEENDNLIVLGKKTTFSGTVHLSCVEGTDIIIGEDCMFSADIEIRTGDAHSILDKRGNRINPSKNIKIGNHCWIGYNVIILKGSEISSHSVVGAGSIVCKQFIESGVVIAGNPARVVKANVDWKRERI